ncbi:MAG: DNA-binding response regulator [Sciscionella sp.]
MQTGNVVVLRGEEELFTHAAHLFTDARDEVACAARDMRTWARAQPPFPLPSGPVHEVDHAAARAARQVRKLYQPGVLLDPSSAQHLREVERPGGQIRITKEDINETIIIDRRVAILAANTAYGPRNYSVVTQPGVVQAVRSLFEAAWQGATELAVYDRGLEDVRALAPQILMLLRDGIKDEAAARELDLSVRTYRRRVAELLAALDATSRFQAGVRARELGLV